MITDLNTRESGSMTASAANGFVSAIGSGQATIGKNREEDPVLTPD